MTDTPVVIAPDAPLAQAIRLMATHRISGLPVIDAAGAAVGMLTEGDLLRRQEIGSDGGPPGWFASFFTPGRIAAFIEAQHPELEERLSTVVEILSQPDRAEEGMNQLLNVLTNAAVADAKKVSPRKEFTTRT
ncbi:MAG: CBS domain-containing protein, partial [Alphaproteobacteria bacterium]|nr:CBS domain-containing protein [Alphaproteobacteria bacterium]